MPTARAQGDLDRVCELVHPTLERTARVFVEADLLRHVRLSRCSCRAASRHTPPPRLPVGRRSAGAVMTAGVQPGGVS
ncbi:hypothetical protein TOK_4495 [Pseudonocardia sp. N23]|nr:hypothetical protein TOK_4495 [Pseudonocardia sp. N23]